MPDFTITEDEIESALKRLGELAAEHGKHIELLAVGGAVMVLRFASRPATRDIDAVILAPEPASDVREWVRQVAEERGWPEDWLNDGAKGFITSFSRGNVLLSRPGITVHMPALEQMLALKLSAWRDDRDVGDAIAILQDLRPPPEEKEQLWQAVAPFVRPGREQSASYAFETVWEIVHGLA